MKTQKKGLLALLATIAAPLMLIGAFLTLGSEANAQVQASAALVIPLSTDAPVADANPVTGTGEQCWDDAPRIVDGKLYDICVGWNYASGGALSTHTIWAPQGQTDAFTRTMWGGNVDMVVQYNDGYTCSGQSAKVETGLTHAVVAVGTGGGNIGFGPGEGAVCEHEVTDFNTYVFLLTNVISGTEFQVLSDGFPVYEETLHGGLAFTVTASIPTYAEWSLIQTNLTPPGGEAVQSSQGYTYNPNPSEPPVVPELNVSLITPVLLTQPITDTSTTVADNNDICYSAPAVGYLSNASLPECVRFETSAPTSTIELFYTPEMVETNGDQTLWTFDPANMDLIVTYADGTQMICDSIYIVPGPMKIEVIGQGSIGQGGGVSDSCNYVPTFPMKEFGINVANVSEPTSVVMAYGESNPEILTSQIITTDTEIVVEVPTYQWTYVSTWICDANTALIGGLCAPSQAEVSGWMYLPPQLTFMPVVFNNQ